MSEPKWTRGEWIFEPHNGYGSIDPDGEPWPFGYLSTATHTPIFELSPILEYPIEALRANARLIAAAPELYDALILAEGHLADELVLNNTTIHPIGDCPVLRRVRSALAKARGEQ